MIKLKEEYFSLKKTKFGKYQLKHIAPKIYRDFGKFMFLFLIFCTPLNSEYLLETQCNHKDSHVIMVG